MIWRETINYTEHKLTQPKKYFTHEKLEEKQYSSDKDSQITWVPEFLR